MKTDKIKLYFLELTLSIILFIVLIVPNGIHNIYIALILLLYCLVFKFFLKKKKIKLTTSKNVNIFIVAAAILYIALFYLFGYIINSYLKVAIPFNIKSIINNIIPLILVIVFSEYIRLKLLSQNIVSRILKKRINISQILTFIIMVLIDMIVYTKTYSLTNLEDFLTILGFVFFSSISSNLFFNYIANRYGILGNIFYRTITVIYVYIIPIIPNMYVFFKSFFRMIYPFILYIIIENTYGKKNIVISNKDKKKNIFVITIFTILMINIIMLVSCQFKYGILVIGSESMTGAINKGDTVIFKKYHNQVLKEGDIPIFIKNNNKIVHRIIKVEKVNNIIKYYTKGDYNDVLDNGYITNSDIIGVVSFKIKYIGYPTLWLNDMFE